MTNAMRNTTTNCRKLSRAEDANDNGYLPIPPGEHGHERRRVRHGCNAEAERRRKTDVANTSQKQTVEGHQCQRSSHREVTRDLKTDAK